MFAMYDTVTLASAEAPEVRVAFEGFSPAELAELEEGWRLGVAAAGAAGDCYRIAREPWSEAAQSLRDAAGLRPDAPVRVAAGDGDALVNGGGVVWIAPGARAARVATAPAAGSFEVGELIGAAVTQAMALAGRVPLHGMAAEVGGIGLLAVGDTMAGKSTLALAALHAGGRVVSDDFLLVGGAPGRPEIGALRRDVFVREGSFELIPDDLRERFSAAGAGPGRRVLRRDDAPERFAALITPDVVWFLDGEHTAPAAEVRPVSQAAALASLITAASPLFASGRYREERAGVLPALTAIAESARCFAVRAGEQLLRAPAIVIGELLARSRSGRA
jgi:hypothetical protein